MSGAILDLATYAAQKEQRARTARIARLITVERHTSGRPLQSIGNDWTRAHFDGSFWLAPVPGDVPGVSLVFVQSREGNTVSSHPSELGGGDTDLHLIYEGLSRVAADGVLSGTTTARGEMFFSVWHPDIVALRMALGLPRHPAQIIVTGQGNVDLDRTLLFNTPEERVYLIASELVRDKCRQVLQSRPWIHVLPLDDGDIAAALRKLAALGIRRISCVGGRRTATSLIDAGMVQELYLTTGSTTAGEPDTRYYAGSREPQRDLIVRKETPPGTEPPIVFEHFLLRSPRHRGAI